jgi:hypothetical protein
MDIDFQSEEEEAVHRRKLENGELINVMVSSYIQCSCCGNWKLQDCLGGIIVESEQEAIEVFKEHFPLGTTV